MKKPRHLLAVHDLTRAEILNLFKKAKTLKKRNTRALTGRTLGLFFEKSSTRTRVSFEVAMAQLGGHSIFLTKKEIQIERGETIADTARALSRYLDGLVIRTFDHHTIEEWSRHATIPVINGLTDLHHPCQALGDLFTVFEQRGKVSGLKLAYIGDGNNVANSLIEGALRLGMNISLACPKGYEPNKDVLDFARQESKKTGASIQLSHDPEAAAKGADILYTDVWTSMGQESEAENRRKAFQGYQINRSLLKLARPSAGVMHCLPAHRGEEITEDVMEGPQAIVWDQAENRLHIQKAILETLLS
jgi:ornithine carbamoyltransferase